MGRFRHSVRARTVLFGTLVVAVFLVIAGVTFDSTARSTRLNELERAAREQLESTCGVVEASIPSPLPTPRDSLLLVQMVAANGKVLSSSANVMDMDTAFAMPWPNDPGDGSARTGRTTIDGGRYLLVGRRVSAAPTSASVFVAAPLSDVDRLSRSLRRQLLWWSPAFLLCTAAGLALVVSRSLRPVEQMRRRVATIEATDLGQRVEEPPTNDELGRLARTMNQMLDRLRVSADRQQRFVSDASHELRTPLAVMRTRLEVALRNPDRTDWPNVARAVLDQNLRMERLVSNLLTLARGSSAPNPHRSIDLDDTVGALVSDMRLVYPQIVFDLSRVSAGRVQGDPDELSRVVQNLLDNAAAHANQRVLVSLARTVEHVELGIEDDGPGIANDERERVFGRFTRLDADRSTSGGGAGLGLAIAADIVQRHGGTIRFVDPVSLPGARAVVTLPVDPAV